MKQRDVFAVALIAIIAAIGSWVLVSKFIATPANRTGQVELVPAYSADFNQDARNAISSSKAVDFSRDPDLGHAGTKDILQSSGE